MIQKIHFLGIGGSGASAAAALAEAQGFEVTGCDLEPHNEFTAQFKSSQLLKGHSASHIVSGNVDILAVTPAIFSLDPDNPELMEAKKMGIPIITWQQFVGEYLAKGKFVIAICGTHGKTTTTAMVAQMLEDANLDPTVLLGAIQPEWKANFRIGKSKYFVVEADEFNDNFLHFKPNITVVTNTEMDHPEYFKDINAYLDSFEKFLLQSKDTIVANLLDKNVAEIVKDIMKESKVSALDFNKIEVEFNLKIPGEYNISNAKAAFQVGLLLGIDPQIIRKSLENYAGVGRRFEFIGDYNGAKVYSDFGHHPTEIRETLKAAREKFKDKRILVIYQPHMFTRTKYLYNDFVKEFREAPVDKIFIMDIYQSREHNLGEVSSEQLTQAVDKDFVSYIGSADQVLEKLKPEIKNGDILFFMSAGDTDKLAKELVAS